jgi:hypothetical protein
LHGFGGRQVEFRCRSARSAVPSQTWRQALFPERSPGQGAASSSWSGAALGGRNSFGGLPTQTPPLSPTGVGGPTGSRPFSAQARPRSFVVQALQGSNAVSRSSHKWLCGTGTTTPRVTPFIALVALLRGVINRGHAGRHQATMPTGGGPSGCSHPACCVALLVGVIIRGTTWSSSRLYAGRRQWHKRLVPPPLGASPPRVGSSPILAQTALPTPRGVIRSTRSSRTC